VRGHVQFDIISLRKNQKNWSVPINMMKQSVLPFKIAKTDEQLTAQAGLSIYVELYNGLDLDKDIRQLFPKPGSGKGFSAQLYVLPILMLFLLNGKFIEDVRKVKLDRVTRKLGKITIIPTPDAIGDWMRNLSDEKIKALEILQRRLTKRFLKLVLRKEHILDIDAFSIFSGKDSAQYTYKGETGYMPIVGHLADLDWCIGYEFREGNTAPADRNYEFILKCLHNLPAGHKILAVRSDSAAYQAKIINLLTLKNIKFTITAVQNSKTLEKEIQAIPHQDWKRLINKDGFSSDREYAETFHTMEETDDYFRIVLQRWPNPKRDLFGQEPEYCYYIIATNYSAEEKAARDVIFFHRGRCNSENYYKEAKSGFNLDYLPCDDFKANAIWFALGLMAYNFHIFVKEHLLPSSWRKKTIARIRFELIYIAGKITYHAKQLYLNLAGISDDLFYVFNLARRRCFNLCFP